MKKIVFGVIGLITLLWAEWRNEVIYSGTNQIFEMVIGNARNDGHPRIYARMANLGLVELGFSGGGQWSFDIIDILPSPKSHVGSFQTDDGNLTSYLIVGQGRNDGVNRIYFFPYYSDSLYEYTYSNGDWVKRGVKVRATYYPSLFLIIASGRNDDTLRVYGWDSPPYSDTLYELTWRNGGWNICRIPFNGGGLIACEGRSDDTVRLYTNGWPAPLELTYRGEWSVDTLFSLGEMSFDLMANGHNDGLNRLYGVSKVNDTLYLIYEITYQHGGWEKEPVCESPFELVAGVGRNDDTIRLYTILDTLWEYTYRDSWMRVAIDSNPAFGHLYIGKGRGDDTNRLYLNSYEYGIIEYSYGPTGIGENKKIPQEVRAQLLITPNPSLERFKIQYEVSEGPIYLGICDAMGRLVRKFVDGNKIQGKYQIYWDGKDDKGNNVGEGVFFCQLKSGGNTFSKKLIRLK